MIEELLAVLTAAGLEPEPRELRDALWLAGHVAITERTDGAVPPPREPVAASEPAPPPPVVADASTPAAEPTPPAEATTRAELYAAGAGGGSSGDLPAMEARSPAVPALRRQMQLARALRPFKRRVPSRTSLVVDEDATAAGVAEEGMWLPVLRPASARWLDLALVVDTAPSMVVWRRTVAELRTLAERLGAFRTVRVFAIDGSTDPSTPLTVRPESLMGGPAGLGREPATLIDSTHRQAILVVTDAVSGAWRDGRMDPLLRRWGATAPLAVATVLPQRMWAGTGLRAFPAQMHAPTPGLTNGTLVSRARGGHGAAPVAVPIPVMELSARWLAQWARLVAGAPDWRNAALLAPPSPAAAPASAPLAGGSAAEVVRRFRAAASPTAFQLASYLSAAWLNLPVMRLVQRVMLPESDTAHLAEVFLGGLLMAVSTGDGTADPEAMQYDFLPRVRDELNNYLLRDEILDVLRETSQFVAERFGQPLDFAALLADPEGAPLPALAGDGGPPLAYVAATVLAKLGGRYRALADRLASAAGPAMVGGLASYSADTSGVQAEIPDAVSLGVPTDLRYTSEHEWVRRVGPHSIRVGITDYQQDALADIVYVDLPPIGTAMAADEPYGEVESVVGIADFYAPVDGTVTARNDRLDEMPELINSDPYGEGWLIEIALENLQDLDTLLSPAQYAEFIADSDALPTEATQEVEPSQESAALGSPETALSLDDLWLPDPTRSRAVLIGCVESRHTPGLPPLPHMEQELHRLLGVLTDPALVGLDPERCEVLLSPTLTQASRALATAAADAEDLLLVCITGHGVTSSKRPLAFVLDDTSKQLAPSTMLDANTVRETIKRSRARAQGLVMEYAPVKPGSVRVHIPFQLPGSPEDHEVLWFEVQGARAPQDEASDGPLGKLTDAIVRGLPGPEPAVPLELLLNAVQSDNIGTAFTRHNMLATTRFHLTRNAARSADHPQTLTSNNLAADATRPAAIEQTAWERRCLELLTIWPLPTVEEVNPYDIGVFYSSRADAYRGGRPRPPYVPRAVDEELAGLLRAQPLVLVKGQSRTGKSRTAFEVAARELPSWRLLVPKDRAALAGLGSLQRLPGEGERVLVWLDDLDQYLAGEGTEGLDAGLLGRLTVCDPPMKVLATMRLEEHARLAGTQGELGRLVRELLNRFDAGAITLPVGFDDPAERAAITELYPGEQVSGGLAEHLAAAHELVNVHGQGSEAISLDRSRERTGEHRPVDPDAGIRFVDDLLPPPPIWFRDRRPEIERLGKCLSDLAVRLVVIVGREGIGKTAMLSQFRESLRSDSSRLPIDGFVYLSAEGSRRITSEALLDELRKVLPHKRASRIAERSEDSALTQLAKLNALLEELHGTRVVVVIDNTERLLDSGGQLRDPELNETAQALLLRRDHAVTLVFATREVPTSLIREFPSITYRIGLDAGLPSRDAIDLLRSLDSTGVLGLRSASVEDLGRARLLTGGHPRALHALYSVLATDPNPRLPQLLNELERLPSNQDVLDFLMSRVFDQLSLAERRVVQALAVYGQPMLPTAVDYLLQPYLAVYDSRPDLRRLLSRRLIHEEGERFCLSSADVERVLSRIPLGRPADRDRDPPPFTRLALLYRAANYLATTRKSRVERLSDLSAEFMEIDLRIRGEEHEAALRLITDVDDRYLRRWGYSNAVMSWRQGLVGNLEDQRLELVNLVALGGARRQQDDQRQAMDYYHAALRLAEELRDNTLQIRLRTDLGSVHLESGEVSRAANYFTMALDAARRYSLRLGEARALGGLCLSNGQMGQFRQALERHTVALAIVDEVHDEDAETLKAELLLNAGWLHSQIGRTEEALQSFRWGRTLAHRRGDQLLEGHFLIGEAEALIDDGNQARAIELASEAAAIGARMENPYLSRGANTMLALAYLYGGDVSAARRAADLAARYRRAGKATLGTFFALQGITALRQGGKNGRTRHS